MVTASDPDLHRFVLAQDEGGTYDRALAELRRGRKTSHWMWFVFPQLAGLGRSPTAVRYGLASKAEADAFLMHPVLGGRMHECCEAVLAIGEETSAEQVLGHTDALKLRSSMTLFLRAAPDESLFRRVLERWYGGSPDPRTDELLTDDD